MSASKNSLRGYCDGQICILKSNTVAHKLLLGRNGAGVSKGDEQKVLRLGLFAKILPYNFGTQDVALQIIESESFPIEEVVPNVDDKWLVDKNLALPVLPSLVRAFIPVANMDRVKLAQNVKLCEELAKIKVGSRVYLCTKGDGLQESKEEALVRYLGPIPELGNSYYYGLDLDQLSQQGDSDGTLFKRKYFSCKSKKAAFVSIDRLLPFVEDIPENTHSNLEMKTNGKKNEAANYKTTLVLHLKEKENTTKCPPSQKERLENVVKLPARFERIKMNSGVKYERMESVSKAHPVFVNLTEKLIDVEPSKDCPLKLGDRVVWVSDDRDPELGTVCWLGVLDTDKDLQVGVNCDNPVGTGTGTHNNKVYFQTKPNHALFIPIHGLLKEEDFLGKPEDKIQKKLNSLTFTDNCNISTLSHHCDSLLLQSRKPLSTNLTSKTFCPEWTGAVVQLPDYEDSDITVKHSTSKNAREDVISRSEYAFTESIPNINKSKLENTNKQAVKGSNSVAGKVKIETLLPIDDSSLKDYFLNDSIKPSNRRKADAPISKNSKLQDIKTRQSYSQELKLSNSLDLSDFVGDMWATTPEENSLSKYEVYNEPQFHSNTTVPHGKPNSNDSSGLFIAGMGLNNQSVSNKIKAADPKEALHSPGSDSSNNYYDTPTPAPDPVDLGVGSVVEVFVKNEPRYGVIRWIGLVPEDSRSRKVAGIEMEEELMGCSDGTFNGRRYFHCNPKKAFFIGLNQCQRDGRFQDSHHNNTNNKTKSFGPDDCPVIPGAVKPRTVNKIEDLNAVCGKYKGIQGHHNSCYLDATLFSMFAFTSAFDSLLFRPRTKNDVPHYEEVQRVLREEIVNPLRKNQFCKWDRVMKLRTLLENHSSVTGLTSEEKDPEEFLTSLVAQILRAKPFLKLSSGQEAYHYQLFVDKDEQLQSPTVQQLFEQSFLSSDIKLKEVPSCLIIQMPRFGKSYKMYPRIFPSQLLDVTDIIEDSPRQCTVCGKHAEYECKECFGKSGIESSTLESISFCANCLDTAHSHKLRSSHRCRQLTVPSEFSILQDHYQIPRLYMQLFAVVCIETSHYVSFVKCGNGDAPWCFFDSMADRKGEQNGYNIPEVVSCPNLPYWLSEDGVKSLSEVKDDRQLPEHAKRLLCDAYMCMYQSTEMTMYR